jgi:hypothetical protein
VETRATFQLPRFWSNPPAPCSIPKRFDTLATFQPPRFWLNAADVPMHAHSRLYDDVEAEHRVELAV